MNKAFSLLILATFVIFSIGMISACEGQDCPYENTIVKGIIYQDTESNPVSGANVQVTCTHNGINNTKNTISDSNGNYSVTYYSDTRCDYGNDVTVSAYKSGIGAGTETGEVDETYTYHGWFWCSTLNVGIVNVPLVPEFGMIAGLATILGAVGLFFYVRKK